MTTTPATLTLTRTAAAVDVQEFTRAADRSTIRSMATVTMTDRSTRRWVLRQGEAAPVPGDTYTRDLVRFDDDPEGAKAWA